jgi:hypothetical protein
MELEVLGLSKKPVYKKELWANLPTTQFMTSEGAKGSFDVVWKTTLSKPLQCC